MSFVWWWHFLIASSEISQIFGPRFLGKCVDTVWNGIAANMAGCQGCNRAEFRRVCIR